MGASLGLLAFMLAFSFSRAQSHFEAWIDAYLLEISAIDAAYRGADLRTSVNELQRRHYCASSFRSGVIVQMRPTSSLSLEGPQSEGDLN
jgi:hypothetical protein